MKSGFTEQAAADVKTAEANLAEAQGRYQREKHLDSLNAPPPKPVKEMTQEEYTKAKLGLIAASTGAQHKAIKSPTSMAMGLSDAEWKAEKRKFFIN